MSSPTEWSFAAVHDVVADAVPDREMVVCGDVRRTYAEVRRAEPGARRVPASTGHRRCAASATSSSAGSAARTPSRSCCTTAPSTSRRCSAPSGPGPCRSTSTSTTGRPRSPALLGDVGAEAVVYHRRYGPLVAGGVRPSLDVVLIDVDDGSGVAPLPGSIAYEDGRDHAGWPRRRAAGDRRPTTSTWSAPAARPAGRRRCCGDRPTSTSAAMAGAEDATAESIAAGAPGLAAGPWYAVPPLMHAAAQWTAFCGAARRSARSCCTTTRARSTRATDPRDSPSASSVVHDVDRRRRLRPAAGRGAAAPRPTTCRRSWCSAPVVRPRATQHKDALLELHAERHDHATATARPRPAAWPSGHAARAQRGRVPARRPARP